MKLNSETESDEDLLSKLIVFYRTPTIDEETGEETDSETWMLAKDLT